MKTSIWNDYELIDASDGEKLERWGNKILIRPDPQIIWHTPRQDQRWVNADAIYHRSLSGGGKWEKKHNIDEYWNISYKKLNFKVGMLGFKHTGIFPEQAANWDMLTDIISCAKKGINILNLFAYTGGATLACARAGAQVCHVDSSKGMVSWARDNARLSGLSDKPIRWITDDCTKFILREQRRGNLYDGIIMDPPSFGRGTNGELWKLEECIFDFIKECEKIMSKDAIFLILNSYTAGLSPAVMGYILGHTIQKKRGGRISYDEVGLPVSSSGLVLPCGFVCCWFNN